MATEQFPAQAPNSPQTAPDRPLKASSSVHSFSSTGSTNDLKRQRSVSLPEGQPALFPSPSSSFRPPPNDEAEILRLLLSKDRAKREARQRKAALKQQRSNSLDKHPVQAPDLEPAAPQTPDPSDPPSAERTPTKPKANGFFVEQEEYDQMPEPIALPTKETPSRPPSSYMPYLPELNASASNLAKRLSVSISRRASQLSTSSTSHTPPLSPQVPTITTTSPIKIRDYAFDAADPRHIGQGRITPPSTSAHGMNTLPLPLPEGVFEDSSSEGGLSSSERNPWDFNNTAGSSAGRPGELVYTSDADYGESEEDEEPESEGLDLPPGGALYVACYEFAPEAKQEMQIHEGEVIRVFEQLCEGWVVACRLKKVPHPSDPTLPDVWQDEEETGLVPENYLRRYMSEEVEAAGQRLNAMDFGTSPQF